MQITPARSGNAAAGLGDVYYEYIANIVSRQIIIGHVLNVAPSTGMWLSCDGAGSDRIGWRRTGR